jgi:cytochrome b involved in lipid metabolism
VVFSSPSGSELTSKMLEEDHHHQQHKLNGVAEPENVTREDYDDVAAAQRGTMGVAAEAVHHHNIEPLTILPAVLPSSCSSTSSVPQFTPPANPALKPTTTRSRAKVPLEKGYSQMVWLKLLRTEPDLAGSLESSLLFFPLLNSSGSFRCSSFRYGSLSPKIGRRGCGEIDTNLRSSSLCGQRYSLGLGFCLSGWRAFSKVSYSWVDLVLAGLKGKSNKRLIPIAEVKQHCTEEDAWTILRGCVYNISPYIRFHPGGRDMLMKGAGKDCTSLFSILITLLKLFFFSCISLLCCESDIQHLNNHPCLLAEKCSYILFPVSIYCK